MQERLSDLNVDTSSAQDLPTVNLLRVISEPFDIDDFEEAKKEVQPALDDLNKLLTRPGLAAYLDASGRCNLRNIGMASIHRL